MNKSNDTQVRLLSLEHLGTIAARLRRDAVRGTEEDNDTIVNVLSQVRMYVCAYICFVYVNIMCMCIPTQCFCSYVFACIYSYVGSSMQD